ncbi:MAG: hypothetical protein RSD64_00190 [Christensenellaceae bacterium]
MDIQKIYAYFDNIPKNTNLDCLIPNKCILDRGYSPNGYYSLSNADREKLKFSCVRPKWQYYQLNERVFLWYEGDVLKKLIGYTHYSGQTYDGYFECDFSIKTIIRRRLPPLALSKKYCPVNIENLLGREIRHLYFKVGDDGIFDADQLNEKIGFHTELPKNITTVWKFEKWLHKNLRKQRIEWT